MKFPLVYLAHPFSGIEYNLVAAKKCLVWARSHFGQHVQAPWIASAEADLALGKDEYAWVREGGVKALEAHLDGYAAILTMGKRISPYMEHEVNYMLRLRNRPHFGLTGLELNGPDARGVMMELEKFLHPLVTDSPTPDRSHLCCDRVVATPATVCKLCSGVHSDYLQRNLLGLHGIVAAHKPNGEDVSALVMHISAELCGDSRIRQHLTILCAGLLSDEAKKALEGWTPWYQTGPDAKHSYTESVVIRSERNIDDD